MWYVFYAFSASLKFIYPKSHYLIVRVWVAQCGRNLLMNFLRSFLFQKKKLNHTTNCNFSLWFETLLFEKQSNNEFVLECPPTERKLYGQLSEFCCHPLLLCKQSYLRNHPRIISVLKFSRIYVEQILVVLINNFQKRELQFFNH